MSCCGKLNKFNQKKFNETDAVIDMKGGCPQGPKQTQPTKSNSHSKASSANIMNYRYSNLDLIALINTLRPAGRPLELASLSWKPSTWHFSNPIKVIWPRKVEHHWYFTGHQPVVVKLVKGGSPIESTKKVLLENLRSQYGQSTIVNWQLPITDCCSSAFGLNWKPYNCSSGM